MTIPEQVDAYRALLDEKDRLAEETGPLRPPGTPSQRP
jgi:hypothetical protein